MMERPKFQNESFAGSTNLQVQWGRWRVALYHRPQTDPQRAEGYSLLVTRSLREFWGVDLMLADDGPGEPKSHELLFHHEVDPKLVVAPDQRAA